MTGGSIRALFPIQIRDWMIGSRRSTTRKASICHENPTDGHALALPAVDTAPVGAAEPRRTGKKPSEKTIGSG